LVWLPRLPHGVVKIKIASNEGHVGRMRESEKIIKTSVRSGVVVDVEKGMRDAVAQEGEGKKMWMVNQIVSNAGV
jgi:hypothetical protein